MVLTDNVWWKCVEFWIFLSMLFHSTKPNVFKSIESLVSWKPIGIRTSPSCIVKPAREFSIRSERSVNWCLVMGQPPLSLIQWVRLVQSPWVFVAITSLIWSVRRTNVLKAYQALPLFSATNNIYWHVKVRARTLQSIESRLEFLLLQVKLEA